MTVTVLDSPSLIVLMVSAGIMSNTELELDVSQLSSRVKVEVDVLGSPSLTSRHGLCGRR